MPNKKICCLLQGQSGNKQREFSFPYQTVFISLLVNVLAKDANLSELLQRCSTFLELEYKLMKLERCKNITLNLLLSQIYISNSMFSLLRKSRYPCKQEKRFFLSCSTSLSTYENFCWQLPVNLLMLSKDLCVFPASLEHFWYSIDGSVKIGK